jgi:hypothetical protein
VFLTRHPFTAIATLITAIAWALVLSRDGDNVSTFVAAAIVAPAIAVVGVLFERPRRPAVFACAASLRLRSRSTSCS